MKNTNSLLNDPLWNTDKNYKLAIIEHCKYLGIDRKAHPEFMYVARDSLFAPIPDGWVMNVDDENNPYYVNKETKQMQYDHPSDAVYRQQYYQLVRNKIENQQRAQSRISENRRKNDFALHKVDEKEKKRKSKYNYAASLHKKKKPPKDERRIDVD